MTVWNLNKKMIKSISSSGDDYLSNKIFYMVAKMQTEQRPNLATGHLHIPLTQSSEEWNDIRGNMITKDINKTITELVLKVKMIIKNL